MQKKLSFILVAALCVLFTACEKKDSPSDIQKAKYTVILYANGGENLDKFIEKDIAKAAEFINTKDQDYSVRMVAYMKYSSQKGLDKQNYVPGGKADKVYGYELGYNCIKDRTYANQYLALPDNWIIGDIDAAMYHPDYLASVLKETAQNAPAEQYILIIAGHAAGWCVDQDGEYPEPNHKPAAAMTDANFNGRAITAKELTTAVRQAGVNLSTIVFDCCMQNNIEYLSELTDVPGLRYTLASGHTTHGGDYSDLVKELFDVTAGKKDLVTALSNYAETYAQNHRQDYLDFNDQVLMNVDFAVVDLTKLPATWPPIKDIVDYLYSHYNAADSAKYLVPSRNCYQYYNADNKVDLIDYLALMKSRGAPYENDTQYATLFTAVDKALQNCILHHAYALNYVDESTKPKDQAEEFVTMSINLGAKGRIQDDFDGGKDYFICYDYQGNPWEFRPEGTNTWTRSNQNNLIVYNWKYSYDKSAFDQHTGWTKWLKINPVMPFNNPPQGDDGDSNE